MINQILEPDRLEDVICEEWFQPLPLMIAPDPATEFHDQMAAIKANEIQGCRATFRGKTWVVLNADNPLTAFHWLAQSEIQGNPDTFDWGGLVQSLLDEMSGKWPLKELSKLSGIDGATLGAVKRRRFVPGENFQKILLTLAHEYGLIQEAA